jgi:hypothetical protein
LAIFAAIRHASFRVSSLAAAPLMIAAMAESGGSSASRQPPYDQNDYDEDSVIGHQCGRKLVASQAPNNHSATMAAKPATIAKTMRKFDTCVSSPPAAEENQSFFEGDQRRRARTFGGSHSKAASHATTSGFAFVPHTMKALGHHCLGGVEPGCKLNAPNPTTAAYIHR